MYPFVWSRHLNCICRYICKSCMSKYSPVGINYMYAFYIPVDIPNYIWHKWYVLKWYTGIMVLPCYYLDINCNSVNVSHIRPLEQTYLSRIWCIKIMSASKIIRFNRIINIKRICYLYYTVVTNYTRPQFRLYIDRR